MNGNAAGDALFLGQRPEKVARRKLSAMISFDQGMLSLRPPPMRCGLCRK
jgi:hypothetical protein